MTEPPSFSANCRNCGAVLSGPYCSNCGQNHLRERIRIRDWFDDVWDALFKFDSKVVRTAIALTLRPGQMTREYLEGRTVRYVSPLRYAIGGSAIWWLAEAVAQRASPSVPALIVQSGQLITLLSIPVLAALIQLPFLRSRYSYMEYLCLILFIVGHISLWRTIPALAPLMGDTAALIALVADALFYFAYMAWALWGFHASRVDHLLTRISLALVVLYAASNAISGLLYLLFGSTVQ